MSPLRDENRECQNVGSLPELPLSLTHPISVRSEFRGAQDPKSGASGSNARPQGYLQSGLLELLGGTRRRCVTLPSPETLSLARAEQSVSHRATPPIAKIPDASLTTRLIVPFMNDVSRAAAIGRIRLLLDMRGPTHSPATGILSRGYTGGRTSLVTTRQRPPSASTLSSFGRWRGCSLPSPRTPQSPRRSGPGRQPSESRWLGAGRPLR